MTRYDPHPQQYDDARTGPQASREAAGRDETASRVSGDGQGLRGVLSAHPADAPAEASEPSGDVVERASEVLYGCKALPVSVDLHRAAVSDVVGRLAAAGLLADPAATEHRLVCDQCHATKATLRATQADRNQWKRAAEITGEEIGRWRQSLITVEGERDRARDLAAALEADNARLTEERDKVQRACELLGRVVEAQCNAALDATGLHDWIDETGDGDWGAIWENLASLGEEKRAAEARARRAEDALQRILENFGGDPIRLLGPYHRAAIFHEARRALSAADQASDATPSDTTTQED